MSGLWVAFTDSVTCGWHSLITSDLWVPFTDSVTCGWHSLIQWPVGGIH